MTALERIAEAAARLVTATDEDDFAHALAELRDEVAESPVHTVYTNELIGGYTT